MTSAKDESQIPTKLVSADPKFEAFRKDMLAVLERHAGELSADKMLAIASYTVGQLVALQDQRTITPYMAMEIVGKNIELGNKYAVAASLGSTSGSA